MWGYEERIPWQRLPRIRMNSSRLLVAAALVAWMLLVPVGPAAAAAADAPGAAGPADATQVAVDGGPTYVQSPCYIDGDADPDCLCDDGSPAPCDEPEEPPYY